mmetsp:Transcript_82168/g.255142  ORF Transcript_82168/g.255142 Transcript_82168/m.255142 type:complete len:229 (-) Transcript_82168:395-1081(-)
MPLIATRVHAEIEESRPRFNVLEARTHETTIAHLLVPHVPDGLGVVGYHALVMLIRLEAQPPLDSVIDPLSLVRTIAHPAIQIAATIAHLLPGHNVGLVLFDPVNNVLPVCVLAPRFPAHEILGGKPDLSTFRLWCRGVGHEGRLDNAGGLHAIRTAPSGFCLIQKPEYAVGGGDVATGAAGWGAFAVVELAVVILLRGLVPGESLGLQPALAPTTGKAPAPPALVAV